MRGKLSSLEDSGTTARFAIALASLASDGGSTRFSGDKSLEERPMQPLLDALRQLGARCYSEHSNGRLPIVVEGRGIFGGLCYVDGSISSQFASALLIASAGAEKDTEIRIQNPSRMVSYPYLLATMHVLRSFGFKIKVNKL